LPRLRSLGVLIASNLKLYDRKANTYAVAACGSDTILFTSSLTGLRNTGCFLIAASGSNRSKQVSNFLLRSLEFKRRIPKYLRYSLWRHQRNVPYETANRNPNPITRKTLVRKTRTRFTYATVLIFSQYKTQYRRQQPL
jgi:hypothetical protein